MKNKKVEYVEKGLSTDYAVWKGLRTKAKAIENIELKDSQYESVLRWMKSVLPIYSEGQLWEEHKENFEGMRLMYAFFKSKLNITTT